jgi:hypothetical protein
MPAINPNNYNIDFFQSQYFGDITDNSYLSYLFQQNLPNIAPELIDSPAGNFQTQYDEKGLEKDINYTSITNPGSIDEWIQGANFPVSLLDIAYQNPSQNIQNNQYGPSTLQTSEIYELQNPDLIVEDTGYIEYPTSSGGGTALNILTEGLDAVGLGGLNSFLIDFDSPLNDIAKERRLVEAKNRIKDGIIENTVGRINLDPLNLLQKLGGGSSFPDSIFLKDYKITVPADGFLGQAANQVSDVLGVEGLKNIIGGDLPDGAFDWDKPLDSAFSTNTIDITNLLLERTGKGTQNLLIQALTQNKYGPRIEGQNDSLKEPVKAKDANQPSQKTGYLAFGEAVKASQEEEKDFDTSDSYTDKLSTRPSFLDNLGGGSGTGISAAGGGVEYRKNLNSSARNKSSNLPATDGVTVSAKSKARTNRPDITVTPTESEDPTLEYEVTEKLKFQGFEYSPFGVEADFTYDNLVTAWNYGHTQNWPQLNYFIAPARTRGPEPIPGSSESNDGAEPNAYYRGELYWKDGVTDPTVLPKRGLLKYTQDLVNKATNVSGSAARFIGLPNSNQNYDAESGDRRHITMSQGNLVKETKENKYYCRSWSVRNTYNTYSDLIRYSDLWRENQPGYTTKNGSNTPNRKLGSFSTLRSPGIPKIAWEKDDTIEKNLARKAETLRGVVVEKKDVIPYMFSIENLAWKDSPHVQKLPPCEQGPFGGRIMWFPPYNINFTDNTSVNWDTTSFIGRAEPIYTYNNTERTGTLSFTIIVDHPSIINKLKDGAFETTKINPETGEEETVNSTANLETFFAGCSTDEVKSIVREAYKEFIPKEIIVPETEIEEKRTFTIEVPVINDALSFHFKNATKSDRTEKSENTNNSDGYFDKTILTNSGCKEGIVGRCFDYNYEVKSVEEIDSPKLYKGAYGDNTPNWLGGIGGCSVDDGTLNSGANFVNNTWNLEELKVITDQKKYLPCIAKGGAFGTNGFVKYGPKTSIANKLANNTATEGEKLLLWSKKGSSYSNENYCCDLPSIATGITSGGTVYKVNQVGYTFSRFGANERFWGVNPYPTIFGGNGGKSGPIVLNDVKLPDGRDWSFTPTTDIPNGLTLTPGTGISQLIEFLATTSVGKHYTINISGNASFAATATYNQTLSQTRANSVKKWMKEQMILAEQNFGDVKLDIETDEPIYLFKESDDIVENCNRWNISGKGSEEAQKLYENLGLGNNNLDTPEGEFTLTPFSFHPNDYQNITQLSQRRVDIFLTPKGNAECYKKAYDKAKELEKERVNNINEEAKRETQRKIDAQKAENEKERQKALNLAKNFVNECDYFLKIKEEDSFLYDNLKSKLQNFHPAFHSITPEGFNSRINFLQQCGRQGPSLIDPEQPQNTAFGRPPVCVLRLGDFYFTKIIIDSINFTFDPLQWDLNPEGIGVQPMLVNVDLNFKFIGGSTLQGPLTQLQNAVSYNFFANTALYMPLEKIMKRRNEFDLVGTEGDTQTFERKLEDTGYFYGPWASQQDLDNAINPPAVEEPPVEINEEKAEVEELELSTTEEPPSGQGFCRNDENFQKVPDNEVINLVERNVITTEQYNQYPPESFDWYFCYKDLGGGDFTQSVQWKPKVQTIIPLKDGEPKLTIENTSEEQNAGFNQTTKDGQPIFRESNSLRYKDGVPYENDAGQITIQGNFMDVERIGTSGRFSSNIDPQTSLTPDIGKILPQWVYGGLNNEIVSNWSVSITSGRFFIDLEGGSGTGGGSNEAVIWDSSYNQKEQNSEAYNFEREYNTCCQVDGNNLPSTQAGKKLFAFNILERITGYNNWDEWKENYNNGDDFVIEEMQEVISKDGEVVWTAAWYIQVDENSTLGSGENRQYQGGSIKVTGKINQVGLDQIIKILTTT